MIVVIFILLYLAIGASLGGYYSYLRFRDANDRYFDTDDATPFCSLSRRQLFLRCTSQGIQQAGNRGGAPNV